MGLIPHNGLSSPSFSLRAASPGPEPPQAHSFLKPSSSGPAQASRWPLQAQLLPSDCVSRSQAASGRWAPLGPAWVSRRPLQAQVVLKLASPGPAPASQQAISFGSAPAQLPPAFVDRHELSPAKLFRPTSCLPVSCRGPALAREQPLQAPLLPPRGLSRLSCRPTAASRDQVPVCLPAACDRPSSSLTVACLGPTHASGRLEDDLGLQRPSGDRSWPWRGQLDCLGLQRPPGGRARLGEDHFRMI
nr:LOW QUALITY PROTEIN: putative uncharacterized protein FLJ46235 [Symphalangus syndactylus]